MAFDRRITLDQDRVDLLVEQRDLLQRELRDWFQQRLGLDTEFVVQGSFAIGTGVNPLGEDDYDIDIGLILDGLDTRNWDPVDLKKEVYEAFKQDPNRQVKIKEPCITIQYEKDGVPQFHVDIAVYGRHGITHNRQLARGKWHSGHRFRFWEDASPENLKIFLLGRFKDKAERQQFFRLIRYLKRWKDVQFNKIGNSTPPGIALTGMAYRWFQPVVYDFFGKKAVHDLEALRQLVGEVRRHKYGLDITLPVPPGKPVLKKMWQSQNHVQQYRSKWDALHQQLEQAHQAYENNDLALALKILKQVFGDDFY